MQRITLLLLSLSSSFPLNAAATVHQVGSRSDHLDLLPRGQISFPPTNGPCLQNAGKAPLSCSDKDCVDVPLDGVCHIQTSTGFPICGCCPVGDSIACSQCGGDAGGGQCKGSGTTGVAYQGCPCTDELIVFPPKNGPCLQNVGKAPLSCSDKDCVDIPLDGVCHIQTSTGFPICGCCPVGDSIACSQCGGDAGGGQCKGSGTTGVAYQGCPCTDDSGDYPQDSSKVCPESNGQATAKCSDSTCGGDNTTAGVCDSRSAVKDQFGKGTFYTHCACCPDSSISDCKDCGGDAGGGKCSGNAASYGTPYKGCDCGGGGGGGNGGVIIPPPIFPFPIPPPGFPLIPPGTPQPKQRCSNTLGKCSDCEGKQGWCQSGENVGCPCQEDCTTGDNQPACSDETCKGDDTNKCTQGPQDGCDCKAVTDCPDEAHAVGCSACGGADSNGQCKGLADHNNLWKGCDCYDDTIVDSEPYNPFGSAAGLQAAQAQLAGLPQLTALPPSSSASTSLPSSSANTSIPSSSASTSIPSSSASTSIPSSSASSSVPSSSASNSVAQSSTATSPSSTPSALPAIFPTKSDGTIDCGSDSNGAGVTTTDCLWPYGTLINDQPYNQTSTFCTSDPSTNCISSGQTMSTDGQTILSTYCVIFQQDSCAFVIADKSTKFGGSFTGNSCISGTDFRQMAIVGANNCVGTNRTAIAAGPVHVNNGISAQSLCLVNPAHPEVCSVP